MAIVVFRFFCGSIGLLVLMLSAAPLTAADSAVAKRLNSAVETFAERKKAAQADALREFDKLSGRVSGNKSLTAGARRDVLDEIAAAKSQFARTQTFPADDEYAGMELKYCLAINAAFLPLDKAINQAIESGERFDDLAVIGQAQKIKANVETLVLGRDKVTAGSLWRGTFDRGGGTIPYHLRIQKKGTGGSFSGHVEDNPGVAGNWAYDVDGQMSGLALEYAMTKSIRGQFKAVKVEGIVSGNRIIGQVTQVAGNGKPQQGLIILRLAK
jgi:hypothetical protein